MPEVSVGPSGPEPFLEALVALDTDAFGALVDGVSASDRARALDLLVACQRSVDRFYFEGRLDGGWRASAAAIVRSCIPGCAPRGRGSAGQERRGSAGQGSSGGRRHGGRVIVSSPAYDSDLVEAEAAVQLLVGAGWGVDLLASELRADELSRHLAARRATALVVVEARSCRLPEAAEAVRASHRAGVAVVAMGPAFGQDELRASRVGADQWVGSIRDVEKVIATWADKRPVVSPVAALPVQYRAFDSARASVLAAATAHIGAEPPAEWARRAASNLLSHLGAAVLVEDNRVLLDHLVSELRGMQRRRLLEVHLLGLVDAVADSLPAEAGTATRFIAEARDRLRCSLMGDVQRSGVGASGPLRLEVEDSGPPRLDQSATRELTASLVLADGPASVQASSGRVFADLLLLVALACQVPVSVLSVRRSSGEWSTLAHGGDSKATISDSRFFELIAGCQEPTEVADLSRHSRLAGSPLSEAPLALRWAYGVPLRDAAGEVVGVLAVFDRWLRQLTKREQRAMQAAARQVMPHLLQWRTPGGSQRSKSQAARPGTPGSPTSRRSALGGSSRGGHPGEQSQLLRSHEVACLFDVTERTVINWAAASKLPSLRTVGGHLRFRRDDVFALLSGRSSGTAS